MIATIQTETAPLVVGWRRWAALRRNTPSRAVSVFYDPDLHLLKGTLTLRPGRPDHDRVRAGALMAELSARGAHDVVLPSDFPWIELLPSYGLAPATAGTLTRRLATRIAVLAAEQAGLLPPDLKVALYGRTMTGDMARTAEALCVHARSLALRTERSTASFCRALGRRYGVSVLHAPTDAQLTGVDMHILFDRSDGDVLPSAHPGALVLPLYDGVPPRTPGRVLAPIRVQAPPRLAHLLPAGLPPEPILAALVCEGRVDISELVVSPFEHSAPCPENPTVGRVGNGENFST